jgi:hypothetical protein
VSTISAVILGHKLNSTWGFVDERLIDQKKSVTKAGTESCDGNIRTMICSTSDQAKTALLNWTTCWLRVTEVTLVVITPLWSGWK